MNALSHQRPTAAERLAELARLVRRIGLLREQGSLDEAKRMRDTELGNAVRDFRLAHGPDALTETELRAIEAREEQRIADALVLAEILIPQLIAARAGPAIAAERLPSAPSISTPRASEAAVISFPDSGSDAPRAPSTGSPAIPDLLDAMLAAERKGRRATANQRQ